MRGVPSMMADVGWVRTSVLFFAVCGPKYTELSLPVRKCPEFATPFSD